MGTFSTTPEAYVFNDGNANNLLPMMACMNGGGMGGYNSPFWALIMLAFLRQWGCDGNGNNGCLTQNQLSQIQDTLNTNNGNQMLLNAITGNGTTVKELASAINCNYNAVQAAISGIQQAICNLGSKNDMSAMQIVNAINSGNAAMANQLSNCCCDVKQLVTTQGYEGRLQNLQQSQLIQNGFAQVGYASAEQTCAVKQAIADQTLAVLNKLDAQEDARKDREIASLTAQVATLTARAERQSELAPIYRAIERMPNTVPVQWPQLEVWQRNGYYDYGRFGGNFG